MYEKRYATVTSQAPVEHCYDMIGNPTSADAVLDRLVYNAYCNKLSRERMRRQRFVTVAQTAQACRRD
ncbi:ATP-binding protein [Agrobacterium tumefaciens]|uniref:ATP-binding protein n=1 Tax=Agrobacterium tumefaciens TaxID=358 RepID=UPI003013A84A